MVDNVDKNGSSEKKEEVGSILRLSSAPHLKTKDSVTSIMWMVVLALMPATVYSVYIFGINALILLAASVGASVAGEAAYQYLMKKPVTVKDGSAVITGLLVAMNVPPLAPVWIVVIGSFFAVIIVKQLFGGLGFNIFNPALAARAFLMASWPVHMTTNWYKFGGVSVLTDNIKGLESLPPEIVDIVSRATPLTLIKEAPRLLGQSSVCGTRLEDVLFSTDMLKSLFVGNVGGCIGETSALLLLIGGIFLLYNRIITWHIPVSFIGTVGVLALLYYAAIDCAPGIMALRHIVSGGLFLGAFFMATDMVTSPVSGKGMLIFGMGCGVITFVIRIWGGYPEGVSYSIILMNAVVPLIDRFTKPGVFGK